MSLQRDPTCQPKIDHVRVFTEKIRPAPFRGPKYGKFKVTGKKVEQ